MTAIFLMLIAILLEIQEKPLTVFLALNLDFLG